LTGLGLATEDPLPVQDEEEVELLLTEPVVVLAAAAAALPPLQPAAHEGSGPNGAGQHDQVQEDEIVNAEGDAPDETVRY
jgi:hypothetical protein